MDGGKENFIIKPAYFLLVTWRRLDDQTFYTKGQLIANFWFLLVKNDLSF